MADCTFPHHVHTLYGVKPQPVENLPQTCEYCGEAVTYAPDLVFVSVPKMTSVPGGVEIIDEEFEPDPVFTSKSEAKRIAIQRGKP